MEAAVRTCITTYSFRKILQNCQLRTFSICNLQLYWKRDKETSVYVFSVNLSKFLGSTFIMKNLIIKKNVTINDDRHSYYNKEISWSRQLFQRIDIVRESVNLRTIDRKLALKLKVIFNSFTGTSFLKYATNMFYISYYFQEKHLEVF